METYQKTERFINELKTAQEVQRVAALHGTKLTIEEAHSAWAEHSDDYCAGWLCWRDENPVIEILQALTKYRERHKIKQPKVPERLDSVKLYEITAIITRSAVVAATSEAEAMEHVATWEKAWESSSDWIGVSDVSLSDSRPLKASDWTDEAHEITIKARALLNTGGEPRSPEQK